MKELSYRLLKANEAGQLVAFVESIYGSSYPSDIFNNTEVVEQLVSIAYSIHWRSPSDLNIKTWGKHARE